MDLKKMLTDRNQRRIMYFLLALLSTIPLLIPIGLPMTINDWTREAYEYVESVPAGSTVIVDVTIEMLAWNEVKGASVACMRQIFEKGDMKVLFVPVSADAPVAAIDLMNTIDMSELVYGENWVLLPFLSGGETAYAGVASNIRNMATSDFYGNPLDSLPMMDGLNSMDDFEVVVLLSSAGGIEEIIRQWAIPYDKKPVPMMAGMLLTLAQHYYAEDYFNGLVPSIRGGAEYEKLTGNLGSATSYLDSLSLTHIYVIALFVVGNIVYFREKGKGGKN